MVQVPLDPTLLAMTTTKDLAYFVAMGPHRFRWAAWWAVRSLRWHGFDGDIVVITDRPYDFGNDVRNVVVADRDAVAEPKWMKMRARHHIAMVDYRCVVFLDSDIAVSRPLDPFLSLALDQQVMVGTDDLMNCIGEGFSFRCLEPDEIELHRSRRAINSGFIAMPGAHADEWLLRWEHMQQETLHRPGPGWDQPGLNACMVRGIIPIQLIEGQMWFPGRDPEKARCIADPILVHFHGIGRHLNRFWRMRRFVRRMCA